MADLLGDGMIRVSWVPSIASVSGPTVAELNAGTPLEMILTPDGLNLNPDNAKVDTSALGSTFNTEGIGRRTYGPELTFKRLTPTDTAWNLLPYRAAGYIVVRRNLDRTVAWAAGQQVEVYPVQAGEPKPVTPAPNEVQKFSSAMAMTAEPDTRATVAA
jgi:hypothetical protein